MLLSNLTAAAPACSALLTMKVSVIPDDRLSKGVYPDGSRCGSCPEPVPYPKAKPKELMALPLLIEAFVEGAQLVDDLSKRSRKAELHFLASVFANMTMVRLLKHSVSQFANNRISRQLVENTSCPLSQRTKTSQRVGSSTPWQRLFHLRSTNTSSVEKASPGRSSEWSHRTLRFCF